MQEIGRQKSFNQSIQAVLAAVSHGKKSSHEIMKCHLENLSKDLKEINHLPVKIKHVNATHIYALVMHWQSKKLGQKTIYEKVCFIRKASNIAGGTLPPNKALGIIAPEKKDGEFNVSVKSTTFIKNQIIKDICDLQLHFGLKKSEAMQVSYFHDYYDRLFIDRKTAYNHHERYIHYQDKTQRELLINIIKRYQTNQLVPTDARRNISRLHTQVLASQEIYEDEYFRKLYMFNRYKVLNRYCLAKGINFRKIADEVGLRDINQVAKVIKCLENS